MFTGNDLLDIAIKMEENGKTVYDRAQDIIQNKKLKDLLQWMAQEEACHKNWFLQQKKRQTQRPEATDFAQILPDVLQEMMGEKSLSLDEVDFSRITHTRQMLETFIDFEKDTLLFYEFLQTFIQDKETLDSLENIIQEETAHVKKLTEMLEAVEAHSIPEETLSLRP
jgi:rubrerythrin